MNFLDNIGLTFVFYYPFIFPIIIMYWWHRRFPKKSVDTAPWRKVLGWIVFFVVVEVLIFCGGLFMWGLEYGQTFTTIVYALKKYNLILIGTTVLMIVEYFYSLKARSGDKEMNMKRLKNTLLYIVQTPVALLAAIIFSTWLRLPDWAKKIWYRFY